MPIFLPSLPQRGPNAFESLLGGLAEGIPSAMEKYQGMQQQAQQRQAIGKTFGEEIANLPPEMQKLYAAEAFKNQFAPQGPKPLTELQQSQKALADERLKALQGQQKLFGKLRGEPSEGLEEGQIPQQGKDFLSSLPEGDLDELAAFAGQPGEMGIIGNIAKLEKENRHKEKIESPGYQRDIALSKAQATADSKFYSDLNERKSKQILKKESLNRLENLGKKKVTGKVWESIADRMGLTQLTSTGYREYTAEQKNQFTDFKAIAGSQLSAREFFTLTSAYPNANFSPEANQAIVNNLKDVHDTLDEEEKIAKNLIKENEGKIPEFFQAKVNEKLQEYAAKKIQNIKENTRKILNAQYAIPEGYSLMFDLEGEPLSVPNEKVSELLDNGLADLP